MDPSQLSFASIADVDVLVEDGTGDHPAVLRQSLQSQNRVLIGRKSKCQTGSGLNIMSRWGVGLRYLHRVESLSIVLILGQPGHDGVGVRDPALQTRSGVSINMVGTETSNQRVPPSTAC